MRDISVSILLNQGSRYHWKGPLFSLAALLLVLLGWEALALSVTWLRGVAFPTPGETVNKLVDMLAGRPFLDHSIYTHTLDSLGRWGGGGSSWGRSRDSPRAGVRPVVCC